MKKIMALTIIAFSFLISCKDLKNNNLDEEKVTPKAVTKTETSKSKNTHEIVVIDKIASGGYVYLKVKENNNDYWMSIPNRDVKIGATYYYNGGMEMKNFESKTLNRIFESVIFSEGIREDSNASITANKRQIKKGKTSVKNIEKAPNGISIAELFDNPKAYANKEVIIKGQVVKVNNGIMQVNFVHLQDGTTGNGKFDLTVTTNEIFQIHDIATIKGTVILNKDFGAGYVYDVIIEKAVRL
ncbi:hypothetical protein [Pseudotamlana carrageenivorans]|uniref:DNA-binding protein n=1 Tax=Pseudotamlana carrageenivorans TaxID=2069432 RepID=A0A2I7SHC9_9FLAO|nr:hypothetical protein [Tamlana carrageenivorans]AUS05305.1 hypothetical protein C1A40_07370 [Tamlana carrageenivorans]